MPTAFDNYDVIEEVDGKLVHLVTITQFALFDVQLIVIIIRFFGILLVSIEDQFIIYYAND
jgi:hypothetical protein